MKKHTMRNDFLEKMKQSQREVSLGKGREEKSESNLEQASALNSGATEMELVVLPPASLLLEQEDLRGEKSEWNLSSESLVKLKKHTEGTVWTASAILDHLIRDGLHGAYATIVYRGVPLAQEGRYRSFDRKSHHPGLRLLSDQGEFFIHARPTHGEYDRWLALYSQRGVERAHEEACAMCIFDLWQRLESYEGPGQNHVIFPEDFLVERLA